MARTSRDAISHETGPRTGWPEDGPALLWTAEELGGGYSTPVANGRMYVRDQGVLLCYDVKAG